MDEQIKSVPIPFEPRFPKVLDSTMVKSFKNCPRQFFHEHCCGRRIGDTSIDLVAGASLASGMEITRKALYFEGVEKKKAVQLGLAEIGLQYGEDRPKEKKNLKKLNDAFIGYWDKFGPGSDEEIVPVEGGVEGRFTVDLGEGVLYSGRVDMLGNGKKVTDNWKYGITFTGYFVNEKTINYITKYMLSIVTGKQIGRAHV